MIGLLRRLYVHLEHYNRPYLGDYNAACFNNCLRLDFEYRRSENATEASDASQEASDDNDYLNLEKVVKFLEGLSHSGPRQWNFVRVPITGSTLMLWWQCCCHRSNGGLRALSGGLRCGTRQAGWTAQLRHQFRLDVLLHAQRRSHTDVHSH